MRSADARRLSLIVLAAVAARVLALWVGRPEFTGWLNHTYYYFVQVRGLLEQGRLPYPDMPLLFHLYALVARGLIAAGMEADAAIVASTRAVMCLVPGLIAVVPYYVLRDLNGSEPLRGGQWALVGASAFLPLTVGYLPEFLQKNMLGLLLLSLVVLGSQRLLRRVRWGTVAGTALVAALTVVSHFGTFAALALWGVALFLAGALVDREPRRIATSALGLVTAGAAGIALVHSLDVQRFHRLLVYAGQSLRESVLAAVVIGGRGRAEALLSLAGILLFYGLLYAASRVYRGCQPRLDAAERIFWLASLLFAGLLTLPLLDASLMGRLALFAVLPAWVVLAHLERHGVCRPWVRRVSAVVVVVGVTALAAGELVSARIHNRNHEAVMTDLETLRAAGLLGAGDLVLARTGADHVCNWLFRVHAGTVTSLELEDFERYDRVLVLNPRDGQESWETLDGTVEDPGERYDVMRRNIPRPTTIEPLFATDHLELFELREPPAEWLFGPDGRWLGLRRSTEGVGGRVEVPHESLGRRAAAGAGIEKTHAAAHVMEAERPREVCLLSGAQSLVGLAIRNARESVDPLEGTPHVALDGVKPRGRGLR